MQSIEDWLQGGCKGVGLIWYGQSPYNQGATQSSMQSIETLKGCRGGAYKTGCSSIPQSGIEDRGRHRSSMLCIEDWVAPLNLAELSLHAALRHRSSIPPCNPKAYSFMGGPLQGGYGIQYKTKNLSYLSWS